MDCTDCEELLDVLLRGELPARREAAVRSHLATCQSCRAKHMRRLRIAELNAAAAPAPALKRLVWPLRMWRFLRPAPPAKTPGSSVRLGLLGRMPMVPQVATGTVMLLIVLVGLWSLPQLTRRRAQPRFEEHATGEVIRPTRADVPAVTPTAAPAETSTSAARSPQRGHPPPSAATSTQDDEITAAEQRKNALEAGIVHFRAREYAQATPLLSRALARATNSAEQAMTLLYLARAERAVGHCDRAVNSYAALVRVHSGMAEAQAALREGVACYDELSEPARAQHLLEQAVATRSLAAGARSLLAQRASGNRKPSTSSATPTSGGAGTRAQRMQPADAQGPNSPVSR